MNNIVSIAREFARKAHEGQFRKYMEPKVPYFTHPLRVAQAVMALPEATDEMIATTFLHDVLEDTDVVHDDLILKFGKEIADLVLGLTSYSKQVSLSGIRSLRKKADHEYLGKQKKEVQLIKLEDRYDNLCDLSGCKDEHFIELYCKETHDLLKYIGHANPKRADDINKQCWYLVDPKVY